MGKDQEVQAQGTGTLKDLVGKLDKFPGKGKGGVIPPGQGVSFGTQMILGVDIQNPELKKYYWGFDKEIQLSKLNDRTIEFLALTNNLISHYIKLHKAFKTNTRIATVIMAEIDTLNVDVKTIVRGYRGHEGFTTILSKSSFVNYDIEEVKAVREKESSFSRLSRKKVSL